MLEAYPVPDRPFLCTTTWTFHSGAKTSAPRPSEERAGFEPFQKVVLRDPIMQRGVGTQIEKVVLYRIARCPVNILSVLGSLGRRGTRLRSPVFLVRRVIIDGVVFRLLAGNGDGHCGQGVSRRRGFVSLHSCFSLRDQIQPHGFTQCARAEVDIEWKGRLL